MLCFFGGVDLVYGIVHAGFISDSVKISPVPHILPFHQRFCLEQNVERRDSGRLALGVIPLPSFHVYC